MFDIPAWKLVLYIVLFLLIIFSFWMTDKRNRKNNLNESEYITTMDENGYYVPTERKGEDPKILRTLGSKISCDALREVLGQRIKFGEKIDGTKSHLSGNPFEVDCFEPISKIGIDYNPKNFYSYEHPTDFNRDVYEFYDRQSISASKKDQINMLSHKYFEIPYTVDMCEQKNEELVCNNNVPNMVRKERIKDYIKRKLEDIF